MCFCFIQGWSSVAQGSQEKCSDVKTVIEVFIPSTTIINFYNYNTLKEMALVQAIVVKYLYYFQTGFLENSDKPSWMYNCIIVLTRNSNL